MKIVFDGIDAVFETGGDFCWSIIVENQKKMYEIIADLNSQLEGNEGKAVLSEDNKLIRIDKKLELLSQFIPFDLNKKTLINKITSKMLETALQADFFLQTQELISLWEKLCLDLSLQFPGDIGFAKISAESLFKSAGIELENEYEHLTEKLLDYFELVEEYEGKKLFILLNLRTFITDDEMEVFLENIIQRGYQVIFLENVARASLNHENRFIVDADLCNIC